MNWWVYMVHCVYGAHDKVIIIMLPLDFNSCKPLRVIWDCEEWQSSCSWVLDQERCCPTSTVGTIDTINRAVYYVFGGLGKFLSRIKKVRDQMWQYPSVEKPIKCYFVSTNFKMINIFPGLSQAVHSLVISIHRLYRNAFLPCAIVQQTFLVMTKWF